MEKCPYKKGSWKENLPANIILVLILAAIALLFYLYFEQERLQMSHERRISTFEWALTVDTGADPCGRVR